MTGDKAEGITAAICAGKLAKKLEVEMPITEQVCHVINGKTTARAALDDLMGRPIKNEQDSNWLKEE